MEVKIGVQDARSEVSLESSQTPDVVISAVEKAIKDGYYEVVWNVRELSSNVLIGYEKTPDEYGRHLVVMGDASVSKITEAELKAALGQR